MNLDELQNIGGVQGVADALNTDLKNGISDDRQAICGSKPNEIRLTSIFFEVFLEKCNNYTFFLLLLAAALSLAFGIKKNGRANGWIDGALLILFIFVLVIFTAISSYLQARKSKKNIQKKWFSEGRNVKVQVIRGGRPPAFILAYDLQVGDIVYLQRGYQVPADGIFIAGEALELYDGLRSPVDDKTPFLFYGSRVINGYARMIVTSVGMETVWGEMMSKAMESPDNKCKFEVLFTKLSTWVDFTGLLISILLLIALFIRYVLGERDDEDGDGPQTRGEPTPLKIILDAIKVIMRGSKGTVRVLTTLLSVSLVGIMEGVPVVISIAITYWSRQTLAHQGLERDPLACAKMATVTTICTDIFGGLTDHEMEVDRVFLDNEFICESSTVSPSVLQLLCDGIGISDLLSPSVSDLRQLVTISWAEDKLGMQKEIFKHQCNIVKHKKGNLPQEWSGALVEKNRDDGHEWHLHYEGSPKDILSMCSRFYNIEGEELKIEGEKMRMLEQVSNDMLAEREVIAYACKTTDGSDDMSLEANDLIFIGMTGIRNIIKDDIKNAVSTLDGGGVRTILVAGDCVDVLRPIGSNCGLRNPESNALKGEEFRNLTDEERMQKVDTIRTLGSCTRQDKVTLVKCLKEKGEVVAVLGQRTNDAPALKEADIGLTMGTWSSETANECSELIVWNADFTFLVNVIESGRRTYENIRKFIQFQLINTISSSSVNFIATIVLGNAPITAMELFWLNLVVALLGGLALLTMPPAENLMKMPPIRSSGRLITNAMWRNIAIQVSYQNAICLILLLKGSAVLGISANAINSMICNCLFLCQLFNKFIAREPEKKNIFEGLHQNRWFWVAFVLFLMSQAAMTATENVLGISASLSWKLWALCILIGLISWPLDFVGKCASDVHYLVFAAD